MGERNTLRIAYELAGVIGVDPGTWTLRELLWATLERKRVMGELTAWQTAAIINHIPMINANLNPADINPYRQVVEVRRKEVTDAENKRGWAAIHRYFRGV